MMLELLFKQLGFNPADLKKQVDDAAANFTAVVNHFNARFDTIEHLLKQTNEEKPHDDQRSASDGNH